MNTKDRDFLEKIKIANLKRGDIDVFLKSLTTPEIDEIRAIYQREFKKPLAGSCKNCIFDGLIELKLLTRNKFTAMNTTQKFKLKRGVYLTATSHLFPKYHGSHEWDCTCKNMTDEQAIIHLALDKGKAVYFEELPDNWEQLVEKKRKEFEKEVDDVHIVIKKEIDSPVVKIVSELEKEVDKVGLIVNDKPKVQRGRKPNKHKK